MSYVLIIGAKSDIAKAISRQYAKNGYDLYLAGRNINEIKNLANDIYIRTKQKVELLELDILDYSKHESFYDSLDEKPVGVIFSVGYLGDQDKAQRDFTETHKIISTNYTGIVSLLNIIANDFEQRGSGFIVGITSVAGERGRMSNYIYGSSKAALTTYLSGLRNRLYHSKVHVLTVKPGFVDTKMTEGMDLPRNLTAQPDDVARDIFHAQQNMKNVIYTKRIWRLVMLIIKVIPEWKFKRMRL